MSKKIKGGYLAAVALLAGIGYVVSAAGVSAATSATGTLTTLMNVIIETSVEFATVVITNYWPYLLSFGVLAAFIALFAKFAHLGAGRK